MTNNLLQKLKNFDFTTDSLIFCYETEEMSKLQWSAAKKRYEQDLMELEQEIVEQVSEENQQRKIAEYKLMKMEYNALIKAYPGYTA